MSEKITTTIGDNEYVPPFEVVIEEDGFNLFYEIHDANDVHTGVYSCYNEKLADAVCAALNELVQLRQENEGLKKRCEDLHSIAMDALQGFQNAILSHKGDCKDCDADQLDCRALYDKLAAINSTPDEEGK